MPLNHTAALITIAAPNFDRLVCFYKALFTQETTAYTPNVYAEFQLPGLKLGLYRPKANNESRMANDELRTPHFALHTHVSLCLEVMDLEVAIAHLTALGYPPPGKILTASHGREVYAYDPDGNRLILHQGIG
ncbi:VOC family protein [Phormidium sp. CLA17]|uniref:VOC family protein n=1 Tax=Leptolyngbya sp. Cla-17 TaxID=2803751 RepID=UPI001492CE10|nr:VOC family protein [Leptolyngbya sp. Cla-17]MBM0744249.1 VOC family protein [Leptolyngbya sp. Cla-17]